MAAKYNNFTLGPESSKELKKISRQARNYGSRCSS